MPLPEGVPPGAVIGTLGENIKRLKEISGAYFLVTKNFVIITGTEAAMELGKAAVLEQLQAHQNTGVFLVIQSSAHVNHL